MSSGCWCRGSARPPPCRRNRRVGSLLVERCAGVVAGCGRALEGATARTDGPRTPRRPRRRTRRGGDRPRLRLLRTPRRRAISATASSRPAWPARPPPCSAIPTSHTPTPIFPTSVKRSPYSVNTPTPLARCGTSRTPRTLAVHDSWWTSSISTPGQATDGSPVAEVHRHDAVAMGSSAAAAVAPLLSNGTSHGRSGHPNCRRPNRSRRWRYNYLEGLCGMGSRIRQESRQSPRSAHAPPRETNRLLNCDGNCWRSSEEEAGVEPHRSASPGPPVAARLY